MFQFFNKPGQKGQGSRRTPQATTAQDEEARAVNAEWGDQQVCKVRVLECLDGLVVLYVLLTMFLALELFWGQQQKLHVGSQKSHHASFTPWAQTL